LLIYRGIGPASQFIGNALQLEFQRHLALTCHVGIVTCFIQAGAGYRTLAGQVLLVVGFALPVIKVRAGQADLSLFFGMAAAPGLDIGGDGGQLCLGAVQRGLKFCGIQLKQQIAFARESANSSRWRASRPSIICS
jgi:hypothetical protein